MTKQRIILFDIDYTLFNAKSYRKAFLAELFTKSEYSDWDKFSQQAEAAYIENKNDYHYFEPRAFLELLQNKLHLALNIQNLEDIFVNEELIESSLYKETISVLEKLSKMNITLGIFSAGRIHLQTAKIKALQAFLHKEHVHIFEFSKKHALESLLKEYSNYEIFLIDDILEILYNAKKLQSGVTTIWIKRKDSVNEPYGFLNMKNEKFSPDYTIENLEEVLSVVK